MRIKDRLTSTQIETMRQRRARGDTLTAIAKDLGISEYAVRCHTKDIELPSYPPTELGEDWKPIEGYESLYLISSYGRIYSYGEGRVHKLIKTYAAKSGHSFVVLSDGKDCTRFLVDHLVARAFCPNTNNYTEVGHIDGDLTNNHADNLKWVETNSNDIATYKRKKPREDRFHSRHLSQEEIVELQSRWLDRESLANLSSRFELPCNTVLSYVKGLTRIQEPPCEPGEEWRPIEGFSGYYVSNHGRVFSDGKGRNRARVLRGGMTNLGYCQVCLRDDSGAHTKSVHRLVAAAFVDGRDETNCIVNHIDGNPSNNHADNLEWCTQQHNIRHAIDVLGRKLGPHGPTGPMSEERKAKLSAKQKGCVGPIRKFTDDEVRAIRNDPRSCRQIAKALGVHKSTVQKIKNRQTYGYID